MNNTMVFSLKIDIAVFLAIDFSSVHKSKYIQDQ